MKSSRLRFALAALMLVSTGLFLLTRPYREVNPAHLPLRSFPNDIGTWRGTDLPIANDVLTTLGSGDFLLRNYEDQQQSRPPIDLFIAYFPSQRSGDTIHSPQNCLPGAGWTPIQVSRTVLSVPGHAPFPANHYVIAKGDSQQLVLYWYWAHDRGVASEYLAKFYLVADSIRMHRSDGSLVRITTPLLRDETTSSAEQRLLPFAESIVPLLKSFIPR
ncbi:MAG TPA: EpsI family protein [Candidatus Sulfotelmatobacter sp.]|nr:EpsI family protein [Candidatus Sulfotelmatobacter sp.]